jgi:hypothetical protein
MNFKLILAAIALTACNESGLSGSGKAQRSSDAAKDPAGDGGADGAPDGSGKGDAGASAPDTGNGPDGGSDSDDVVDTSVPPPPRASFGILVNDLRCGMCHVTVRGDVLSTSPVNDWSGTHTGMYDERVEGRWLAAQGWSNSTELGLAAKIDVTGGVEQNSSAKALPKDLDGDGAPDFPQIAFDKIGARMRGRVEADGKKIDRVHKGNAVLIGTSSKPIKLDRDVLVEGDLVIKGHYQGRGTIYVTGNIYIPFDLRAKRSPFPFPDGKEAAKARGEELAKADETDALGLAAGGSILVADLRSQLYDMPMVQPNARRAALDVDRVYQWYPGGAAGYTALYEAAGSCSGATDGEVGSFNMIEAFLYTRKAVAGVARGNSYAVNGGMIADIWHILGTGGGLGGPLGFGGCSGTSPVHGYEAGRNHVNYDHRMAAGLQILEELAPYFSR